MLRNYFLHFFMKLVLEHKLPNGHDVQAFGLKYPRCLIECPKIKRLLNEHQYGPDPDHSESIGPIDL